MEPDRQKFIDDGYVIVQQVISPDMLEPLRDSFEQVVHREWPDGVPDGHFQPRIYGWTRHVDESNINAAELLYHDNTFGVVQQLMQTPDVGLVGDYLMCNPTENHGPWFWHRDFSPVNEGPLQGVQMDFMACGPVYVQWNIALYDDDVFWVVPGSHRRANTGEENRQMAAVPHSYVHGQLPQGDKRHEPLPNSLRVDLKAGDGVVYNNSLLHWGSNYSSKLRRCIHLGYRGFNTSRYFHQGFGRELPVYMKHLPPKFSTYYQRLLQLHDHECNTVENIFRAVLDKDEVALRQHLAILHPGEATRFVCLIHLCKFAQHMAEGKDNEYGPRFTDKEAKTIWQRFGPLDDALQTDTEQYMPGFLARGPSRYRFYDLPVDFGIDEFVAGWNSS